MQLVADQVGELPDHTVTDVLRVSSAGGWASSPAPPKSRSLAGRAMMCAKDAHARAIEAHVHARHDFMTLIEDSRVSSELRVALRRWNAE
jgi:hypothetical protein